MAPTRQPASSILAEVVGDDLPQPLPHLWSCLSEHGSKEQIAVKSLQNQRPNSDIVWTYSDLHAKVTTLATSLYTLGIRKGDAIAAFLDNRAEWALLFWTSIRLDAVFVPLNPRTIQSREEITHILRVIKPAVLIVLDEGTVDSLEQSVAELIDPITVRIVLSWPGEQVRENWMSMEHVMSHSSMLNGERGMVDSIHVGETAIPVPTNDLDQPALIILTSGTTSLPKAAVHTYANAVAAAIALQKNRFLDFKSILLQHLPVFHSWSTCVSLAVWLSGGTVVYPSRTFDARATLSAIETEGCTFMLAVPSVVQALMAHELVKTTNLQSMQMIDLSGTIVLPEIVEACLDVLEAPKSSVVYGMTEGNGIVGSNIQRAPFVKNSVPSTLPCGTAMPGGRLKVCMPGTRTVLERNEVGELHMGGPQAVSGYLDRESTDFYTDGGVNWIVTGDQAKIDDNGMLYILGRYKDVIIRGGVNLSPAIIERCLDFLTGIKDTQVVGIADEIAGEVPVAIVRTTPELTISKFQIQQTVAKSLGKVYSPQYIFELEKDLSLQDFPRTTSGKIKKRDLRAVVEQHLSHVPNGDKIREGAMSTVDRLIAVWSRVSGRVSGEISADERADTFADSITMMQFCNIVRKDMGKRIAVEDLVGDIDITRQAEIVDSRPLVEDSGGHQTRQGPPFTRDMIHAHGDDEKAKDTQKEIEALLRPYGFAWADVEDVYPTAETTALMTRRSRLRNWNRRHAFYAPDLTVQDMRRAVTDCLKLHPTFRSLIVGHETELPLYVVLRPGNRWYNLAISEGHTVETPEDLPKYRLDDDELDYAICPGPLFRMMIVHVRSTNSAGIIYSCHHSTFDALSMSMWYEDVDVALRTGKPPKPHADFKPFAERKFACLDSPNTTAALEFHLDRLNGWQDHRDALWPPQRCPQFFRGSPDSQWTHVDGTPGKPHERKPIDAHPCGATGVNDSVTLLSLPTIKSTHGITAQNILKASLAILNVHRTGADQAFFGLVEAARVWPIEKGDPDPDLPNTMDIAGPTFEVVINRIHLNPEQSLLVFLRGLQEEQKSISKYAQVPWKRLESLLRRPGETRYELHDTVIRRQLFNWLPNTHATATGERATREVQGLARPDIGLQWNFKHVDVVTVAVSAQYDDCQLGREEVEGAVKEVFGVAEWVVGVLGEGKEKGEGVKVGDCPLLRLMGSDLDGAVE
ncbi:MAG: hypothetical protein LQ350_008477 [Teloschistes chrysophthalmus]|nr:MAG: hypothetical protein LQ350_008477 [Niorma chrysophthalma]